MNADEYKAALTTLGISHEAVADTLGIGVRSSYRYAKQGGVPKPVSLAITLLLTAKNHEPKKRKSAQLAHVAG